MEGRSELLITLFLTNDIPTLSLDLDINNEYCYFLDINNKDCYFPTHILSTF